MQLVKKEYDEVNIKRYIEWNINKICIVYYISGILENFIQTMNSKLVSLKNEDP